MSSLCRWNGLVDVFLGSVGTDYWQEMPVQQHNENCVEETYTTWRLTVNKLKRQSWCQRLCEGSVRLGNWVCQQNEDLTLEIFCNTMINFSKCCENQNLFYILFITFILKSTQLYFGITQSFCIMTFEKVLTHNVTIIIFTVPVQFQKQNIWMKISSG